MSVFVGLSVCDCHAETARYSIIFGLDWWLGALNSSRWQEKADLGHLNGPSAFCKCTRCAGEYVPVADRMANGYPLWEHTGGRCWLYSGRLSVSFAAI